MGSLETLTVGNSFRRNLIHCVGAPGLCLYSSSILKIWVLTVTLRLRSVLRIWEPRDTYSYKSISTIVRHFGFAQCTAPLTTGIIKMVSWFLSHALWLPLYSFPFDSSFSIPSIRSIFTFISSISACLDFNSSISACCSLMACNKTGTM